MNKEGWHSWGLLLDYVIPREFLCLRLVCSGTRYAVDPLIYKLGFTFRIPHGKTLSFIPHSAIVYDHQSIPKSVARLVAIVLDLVHCNKILSSIPPSVVDLALEHSYGIPLAHLQVKSDECGHAFSDLPPSLAILPSPISVTSIAYMRFQTIDLSKLPPSVTHFTTPFTPTNLPPTITHLATTNKFNYNLNLTSSNITHLTLGDAFDQPIDKLPITLTHLTTGYDFNQPRDDLPPSVIHLELGHSFDQPIDGLPPFLTHLTVGTKFNQPIDQLPSTLTHLVTGRFFNQPVNNLPPTLSYLSFNSKNTQLGNSAFNQPVNNLPPTLTQLNLGNGFNKPINALPPTLTHLVTGDYFSRPISNLPPSLVCLTTGGRYDQSVDHLPATFTRRTTLEEVLELSNDPAPLKPLRQSEKYLQKWQSLQKYIGSLETITKQLELSGIGEGDFQNELTKALSIKSLLSSQPGPYGKFDLSILLNSLFEFV